MSKYGFDDAELAKLFADAGAAVSKAKVPSAIPAENTEEAAKETVKETVKEAVSAQSVSLNEVLSAPAAPKAASAPIGKIVQINSGTLEEGALTVNTSEGTSSKIAFVNT